jgi:hypothetical protein
MRSEQRETGKIWCRWERWRRSVRGLDEGEVQNRRRTGDEVRERVEVVEPDAPEAGHAGWRNGDTCVREGSEKSTTTPIMGIVNGEEALRRTTEERKNDEEEGVGHGGGCVWEEVRKKVGKGWNNYIP